MISLTPPVNPMVDSSYNHLVLAMRKPRFRVSKYVVQSHAAEMGGGRIEDLNAAKGDLVYKLLRNSGISGQFSKS